MKIQLHRIYILVAFVSWKQITSASRLSKKPFRFFAEFLIEALRPFTFQDSIFILLHALLNEHARATTHFSS